MLKDFEETEKSHPMVGSQEDSLPFPPGWGPVPCFKKITIDESERVCSVQENGRSNKQGQAASEESAPFPPGWGPKYESRWNNEDLATAVELKERARLESESEVVAESEMGFTFPGKMIDGLGDPEVVMGLRNSTQTKAILDPSCTKLAEDSRVSSFDGSQARGGRKSRALNHKNKISKRKRIRQQRAQLRSFFSDLQSPQAQEPREEDKIRKRASNSKAEAEEIVKLGEQIGLRCSIPVTAAVWQIEEVMGGGKDRTEEARRGPDNHY